MPELKRPSLLPKPPSVGPLNLPPDAPKRPFGQDKFADAMELVFSGLGFQGGMFDPNASSAKVVGSHLGAVLPALPLAKLLRSLGLGKGLEEVAVAAKQPSNLADALLREHVLESPRLREFTPVGAEPVAKPGYTGPEWKPDIEDLKRRLAEKDAAKAKLRKP